MKIASVYPHVQIQQAYFFMFDCLKHMWKHLWQILYDFRQSFIKVGWL